MIGNHPLLIIFIMRCFRYQILPFLPLLVTQLASANGDPVMRYSSINRVASPEPLDSRFFKQY